MKKNNKLVTILLASSLLLPGIAPLATGVTSVAAATETVATDQAFESEYVAVMDQQVRYRALDNSAPITVVETGDTVEFVSKYDNRWFKVRVNDVEGYILRGNVTSKKNLDRESQFIDVPATKESGSEATYTVAAETALRTKNAERYRPLKALARKTVVTYEGTTDSDRNWFKVKLADGTPGYVHRSDVTKDANIEADKPAVDLKVSDEGGIYELTAPISSAIRRQAGSQYSIVDEVAKGEVVTYRGTVDADKKWFKVELTNGKVGYIHRGDLTKVKLDTTKLDELVAESKKLVEKDYTPASWATLQSALKLDQNTRAQVTAKVAAIEKAMTDLQAAELKVESVSAINATTVEVKFTQPVDKTAAEALNIDPDFTSKVVTIEGLNLTNPNLSEDGKTLTLRSRADKTAAGEFKAINVKDAEVVVEAVRSKDDADVKTKQYKTKMTYRDTVRPEVKEVVQTTAGKFDVVFTEPMGALAATTNGDGANVKFTDKDGKIIAEAKSDAVAAGDEELSIDLSAAEILPGTEVTVTINGAKDLAGNLSAQVPLVVKVTKPAKPAEAVKVKEIKQTGVKTFEIEFNQDVEVASLDKVKVGGVDSSAIKALPNKNAEYASKFEVTTAANLDGILKVEIEAGKLVDKAGTNTAAVSTSHNFKVDVTAPKGVASVSKDKDGEPILLLTFDKDVTIEASTNDTVKVNGTVVKDQLTSDFSEIDDIKVKYQDPDNKKVVLIDNTQFDRIFTVDKAEYNLEITSANVKSEAGTAMDSISLKYKTPVDESKEVATVKTIVKDTDNSTVKVTFNVKDGSQLDQATALNKANYNIEGVTITDVKLAPASGTTQEATLTLGEVKESRDYYATVENVKVKDSVKVMDKHIGSVKLTENIAPEIEKAELTFDATPALKVIELTFDETVKGTLAKEDFAVNVAGVKVTNAELAGKVITITLDTAIAEKDIANLELDITKAISKISDTQDNKLKDDVKKVNVTLKK